jgi:hypothetical protein
MENLKKNWLLLINLFSVSYIILLILISYYPFNSTFFDIVANLITLPIIGFILFSFIFSFIKIIVTIQQL